MQRLTQIYHLPKCTQLEGEHSIVYHEVCNMLPKQYNYFVSHYFCLRSGLSMCSVEGVKSSSR